MKKLVVLGFLALATCAPQPASYYYTVNAEGQYIPHYGDAYTYEEAQETLNNFCYLPLVDINRILRTSLERSAKIVVCRKDSFNVAKDKEESDAEAQVKATEPEKPVTAAAAIVGNRPVRKPHPATTSAHNTSSPNSTGGGGIYIDVSPGHPIH